jgi:DNA-directed RNA polymerase specialized sigma24 family protein
MDALPGKEGGGGAGPEPPKGLEEAYARILRACVFAGLGGPDAEDVAQDLFLWLTQCGALLAAVSLPWVGAAAQNFIRRYWRARKVRHERESCAAMERAVLANSGYEADAADVRLSLDRMERELPAVEAKLLHMVRCGCSFAEAVRQLGIPRGSRSFFRHRLIRHLAEGLRAPERALSGAVVRPSPQPSPGGRGRKRPGTHRALAERDKRRVGPALTPAPTARR